MLSTDVGFELLEIRVHEYFGVSNHLVEFFRIYFDGDAWVLGVCGHVRSLVEENPQRLDRRFMSEVLKQTHDIIFVATFRNQSEYCAVRVPLDGILERVDGTWRLIAVLPPSQLGVVQGSLRLDWALALEK